MTYKISFQVTEKFDPTRKEIGLKIAISGFSKYKGQKIKLAAFPAQDAVFSKTGSLTISAIGTPGGNNSIEVIDKKTRKVLQQIGSINGNIFTQGDKGQEIIITHKSKKAQIEFKKVPSLKNEILRLDASPKISLFFGLNEETNQPIYTRKSDKKGSFKGEITGVLTDKHEVRVLTGQMTKIASIKPPES
ncbi:MAG: hypothetical protein ACTSPT_06620 [Candidatus Heimdallarchaeota archaeon]